MQPRPLTTSSLWRLVALAALALALSVFAWWPMFGAYPHTQGGDGPVFHKMFEAARISVTRYHELPLWNPYECGGLPLWDNPQAPLGAPLMWPLYFIGTTKTVYLWYLAHSALGFMAMWLLGRRELGLSRIAAFVAAGAWAYSGFHANHYPGGHLVFTPFLYFPFGVLFWRRADRDFRMAIALGLLVALMIYEGGVYPIPHLAVILGLETLTRVWPPKRFVRIAIAGVIVLAVALTVGAARFLPVIDQIRSHTRGVAVESDSMGLTTFKQVFLVRAHERFVPGQRYVWGEYGLYMGPIVILLALVGVALAGIEHLWLVVILGASLVLMVGDVSKNAPWTVLRGHVFPFKDMRVPSRFGLEVTMVLAAFAGLAVDRVTAQARKLFRKLEWLDAVKVSLVGFAMIGVGDIVSVGITLVDQSFGNPGEDPTIAVSPRLFYGSRAPNMIDGPRENLGRLMCWEEWGFGQSAPLWEGDTPQARAENDRATVERVVRTQNTFTVEVTAKEPARILFNTAFDKGWRSDVGAPLEQNKQLVVDVPAGKHRMLVRYRPRSFTLGVVLTFLGSLSAIFGLVWLTRRTRAKAPPPELPSQRAPADVGQSKEA